MRTLESVFAVKVGVSSCLSTQLKSCYATIAFSFPPNVLILITSPPAHSTLVPSLLFLVSSPVPSASNKGSWVEPFSWGVHEYSVATKTEIICYKRFLIGRRCTGRLTGSWLFLWWQHFARIIYISWLSINCWLIWINQIS